MLICRYVEEVLTVQVDTQDCFKSEFVTQQLCEMLAVLDPSDEVGRYVSPKSFDMLPCPLTQASGSRPGHTFTLFDFLSHSSHYTFSGSANQDMATGITQVQGAGGGDWMAFEI